jgi:hypothetical protein
VISKLTTEEAWMPVKSPTGLVSVVDWAKNAVEKRRAMEEKIVFIIG